MRTRAGVMFITLLVALALACGGGDDGENSATTNTPTPRAAAAATAATTVAAATPSPAPSAAGELTVFAAASLTDAFNEMGSEFTKANPRVTLKFNFAASTALRTQIEQGAKADLFASADQVQMDNAKKAGVIDGEDRLFVKNKLVMIYPTGNPGKVASIKDLANPGLKFVLTDKNVPIGAYARTALEKLSTDPQYGTDFGQKVLANLKSEEANVRAVVTKVQLGEADAAIVYASDVTPSVSGQIQSVIIPDQFNTIATYPIAVVKDTSNKAAAQAFIQYARSAAGQTILKKNNFIVDADTGAAWAPRTPALPAIAAIPAASGRLVSQEAARDQAVAIVDNDYEPRTVTVPVGASVTWTNAGEDLHDVKALRSEFDSTRLHTGERFTFQFTEAGTYYYQCTVHWSMSGMVIVVAALGAESAP